MPMELQAVTLQVAGSDPAGSTRYGSVAQRLEQVPIRTDRRRFIILVVMTLDSERYTEKKDNDVADAGETTASGAPYAGSNPAMLVQSVWPSDQAGKCFITLCRHDQDLPRRMPDGTTALIGNPRGSTPRLAGALWHERDPEVSSILVAAATNNRRMLAGLQVARPSQDGRSDVQIIPSPSGGVAQQKRSCQSRRRCGECLRDYRDRAPALRKAGGRVFNPPLSGFSGRVAQYRLANLVAVFSGKTNECRTTLGLAVRIHPAVSAE